MSLCYYTFFSATTFLRDRVTKHYLKQTVKNINQFSVEFIYHIIPHLVSWIESICTIVLSTFISFLKHKLYRMSCQQFFNDRMISTTFENQILVVAKLKHPRNYKKLQFERVPIKFQLC